MASKKGRENEGQILNSWKVELNLTCPERVLFYDSFTPILPYWRPGYNPHMQAYAVQRELILLGFRENSYVF